MNAEERLAVFSWSANKYSVMEDAGTVKLSLLRSGNINIAASVDFATADGTALDGEDYHAVSGTVNFEPGQVEAVVEVPIIDDDIYEPEENFYAGLSLPFTGKPTAKLGRFSIADITIVDDDDPGSFSFEQPNFNVKEDAPNVTVTIKRSDGGDGPVTLIVNTEDTASGAVAGKDYEAVKGRKIIFNHGEVRKDVVIPILPSTEGRNEEFTVQFEIEGFGSEMCGARYGPYREASVTITSNEEFAKLADRIALIVNSRLQRFKVGTDTWGEQFKQAMAVGDGDDDDDDGDKDGDGEGDGDGDGDLSFSDYVLHIGTFFWKIIFAFIPPTSFHGGWWAFTFSLMFIGLLTALVGDLASVFGCTIGLTESVTALTFVALGTSLPDTFASKSAACNDETADASIGNVTGSNSVNVFLGLGIPWLIASLYHEISGNNNGRYIVPTGEVEGALAFGVLVFCICACVAIATIYARRVFAGGELGGNRIAQWATFGLFMSLWLIYVVLASLKSEDKI